MVTSMRSLRRVDSIAGPPPTLLALLGSVVMVAEMPARGAPALVVVLAAAVAAGCSSTAMPPATCASAGPDSLALCIDEGRYRADLTFVTGERTPGSLHHQEVQDRCFTTLSELGFTVERFSYGTGVDVIATRPGIAPAGDDVILGAHYDHIANCPGADDNASGVAAVLEIARALVHASYPRTLVVACWDEEERGLIGSRHHADRAKSRGEGISIAWSLDAIAFENPAPNTQKFPGGANLLFRDQYDWLDAHEYRADFIGLADDVNAHDPVARFEAAAASLSLPTLKLEIPEDWRTNALLSDLRRTDHASFWANDYAAVAVSDSAEERNPNYHCRNGVDSIDTLDLVFALKVVKAAAIAVGYSLGMPAP